jgi:putative aldouronate transport system substrate-binding protein
MKKVLSLVMALALVLSMVGLVSAESTLPYEKGTVLRMAVGYNNSKTGLRFDPEVAGEGVTLADGKTYHSGDFKPTWVAVQDLLGISIEDKYQGQSAAKEFDYWKEQLDQVDMVSGTAAKLSENGEAGLLVNIGEYLDQMPHFKAYLDANPIVRLSITGNVDNGAIYFSPYFDGVDDIEKMPLMRTDWVEKLLNGEGAFAADASKELKAAVYQPYMPTSGKVEIDVVKADGSAVETIAKDYDAAGNIIATMNAAGTIDGVAAVNMLRDYIDKAYNGYYGTNRADLFIGQNAAWDADELVALLRCVVANPQTLNGTDKIEGLFSREENNTARRADMFRFAGILFGVRGLESRQDYLYVGTDGDLHDARQEVATYDALGRMHALVEEGLISTAFVNNEEVKTENYLEQDLGFMHYDYNQTQTVYNATKLDNAAGEKYMAVMVPVARWFDGTNEDGVYMRFTESWRSVKTDGWGISKAGVGSDTNKLNAALTLIDYAYSDEGTIMMSYGPEAFRKAGETFMFNGKEMPVIADATYAELWEKASGNYTNYARQYLGSTLSFMKSQAFEYQCTHEVGKEGAAKISTAIALGTIKHPLLAVADNAWYTSVPTVLPTTKEDNQALGNLTDLTEKFSTAKDGENLLIDIIVKGFTLDGMTSPEAAAEYVKTTMSGAQYLDIKELAWEDLLVYFLTLAL